jgi:hypothetical protein
LTDFLVRHFDRLVMGTLGLDKHPELLPFYFGNYTRLVYLAQKPSSELDSLAQQAAQSLGLRYERIFTGCDAIAPVLDSAIEEMLCHS